MVRENFFYKFLKYKKDKSKQIIKYNSKIKSGLQDQILNQIIEIDKKISENSKALIEAQIVKLKYNFSQSNNLMEKIGRNVYKKKLDDSITWHQNELKKLYIQRNHFKINLEKIKGIYWINRIKRFLMIISLVSFILFCLLIFLSGFMIIIYLMPLIILIILVYVVSTRKN
tara:strand:- start:306 stop:818 length:513 start_codon:yes stop_codon:yes gene_type:complete